MKKIFCIFIIQCFWFSIALAAGDFEEIKSAIDSGSYASLEKVAASGADMNSKNKNGDVPLFFAAAKGRVDFVKLIVAKGGDINAKNNEGWTALMSAVVAGDSDMVKFLLENGADPSIEAKLIDAGKRTAMSLARIKKRADIEEILKKYMRSAENTEASVVDVEYVNALRILNRLLNAWLNRERDISGYFSKSMKRTKVDDDFITEFQGVSTPHNESYEVFGGKKIGDNCYEFRVKLYFHSDSDSAGFINEFRIKRVHENEGWRADNWL